jgi:hypothetical protein
MKERCRVSSGAAVIAFSNFGFGAASQLVMLFLEANIASPR